MTDWALNGRDSADHALSGRFRKLFVNTVISYMVHHIYYI